MNIKKLAKEMKKQNGNQSITNSDMLWYLVHKVDNLDARLDCAVTKEDCKNIRQSQNAGKSLTISIIAVVVSSILTLVNIWIGFIK